MFRLWGKIWKDNHLVTDHVACVDREDTRTHKIFEGLDILCMTFDLSKPIWLDTTIDSFRRHNKTRFYADNFIDDIDFDYMEIEIIEEP